MSQELNGPANCQDYLEQITCNQAIIHKICRLYADTPEERLDLAQEIRLQLWRSWPSFAGQSKPSTWLYQVALNTALTQRRSLAHRPRTQPIEKVNLADPRSTAGDKAVQRRHLLYEALLKLEPGERALALLWLEECSYEEIATISGISVNLVGVRLHRIKERIKSLLTGIER